MDIFIAVSFCFCEKKAKGASYQFRGISYLFLIFIKYIITDYCSL